jgi:hypothetical protein
MIKNQQPKKKLALTSGDKVSRKLTEKTAPKLKTLSKCDEIFLPENKTNLNLANCFCKKIK